MSNEKVIAIDADVVSHFIKGGQVMLLHKICRHRIVILDKVCNELKKFSVYRKYESQILENGVLHIIPFPENIEKIKKEYFRLKSQEFLGDGEAACLAFIRYTKNILASSNLRDIHRYCLQHNLPYITTMDLLCRARKIGLLTEAECNQFIENVLAGGSKLPVKKMKDYLCKDHFFLDKPRS